MRISARSRSDRAMTTIEAFACRVNYVYFYALQTAINYNSKHGKRTDRRHEIGNYYWNNPCVYSSKQGEKLFPVVVVWLYVIYCRVASRLTDENPQSKGRTDAEVRWNEELFLLC
jgi:hypothetical protein